MKEAGYRLTLFFLWLPNAQLAVERVAHRVAGGGHDVPEETIRRRYRLGLHHFFQTYRYAVDEWWFLNGSTLPPAIVASQSKSDLQVSLPSLFRRIEALYRNQRNDRRE